MPQLNLKLHREYFSDIADTIQPDVHQEFIGWEHSYIQSE